MRRNKTDLIEVKRYCMSGCSIDIQHEKFV
jgi:hypothetical protein